jgi:hypothetical protein
VQGLGFPGKCDDPTPGDAFNIQDLEACIFTQHEATVDALIDAEYGTTTGPITDSAVLKCQTTVAKDGGKVVKAVLKAVQKCRNAINKGTITNLLPKNCATADAKTAATVNKAVSKAQADIAAKCTPDNLVTQLDICNPNATTAAGAASCTVATHQLATDNPDPASGDLLDYEYATPASCGDGVINQPTEECDGSDLSGCTAQGFSGPCGSPTGNFACLCLDIPRERAIEHSNSDLDNGWSGQSHDSGTVEGGGYVSDMYDCDGPGGPDTLCTVGPSCVGAPHSPCTKDSDCTLQGGTCRQRAASIQRPHCSQDLTVSCPVANNFSSCGTGNTCLTTFHGAPLPLSSGGIPVCVVNVFSEDVTGTKDLATGQSAVRVHQGSITHLASLPAQPCPVCGGFCGDPQGADTRNCTVDADCATISPAGTVKCVHDPICSGGPNVGKECRPDPPFGGPTALFGNPSVDCPPTPNLLSPAVGLDILFNPATTGTTTMTPNIQCDAIGFTDKRCVGGSSEGRTCTVASECPGGTCNFQCYCPTGGNGTAAKERPNDCDAACVGGGNDALPCGADSDCTGGFCHPADCRPDPGAPAYQQPNEGGCTATVEGRCSASAYKSCNSDVDCQPPGCPLCGPSETCVVSPKNCFLPSEIVRTGQPGVPDSISASTFCIPAVGKSSVNTTAGLPGPGALLQPTTSASTGF